MKTLKKRVALHSPSATPKCNPHKKTGCRLHLGCTSLQAKCNPTKPHHHNVSPSPGCTLHFIPITRTHEEQPFHLWITPKNAYSAVTTK